MNSAAEQEKLLQWRGCRASLTFLLRLEVNHALIVKRKMIKYIQKVIQGTTGPNALQEVSELRKMIRAAGVDNYIVISNNSESAYLYVFDAEPKLVARVSNHTMNSSAVKETIDDKWSFFARVYDLAKKIKIKRK